MKLKVIHFIALALGTCSKVQAGPVVLSKPNLSTYITQARASSEGSVCIVGDTMDPNGDLQARGLVILYSISKSKVLWQQVVPAPDDNAANRFVACGVHGRDVYVAANVDTHSAQALNQSLAWVYRFGPDGKLMAKTELDTGAPNTFAYDVDVNADGVVVAGRTAEKGGKPQANAIFFARLDSVLKPVSIGKMTTGAYLGGASVWLNGTTAYLGGNFAPAHAAADALVDDYAVSKIVAGKYQFSVRPQRDKADDIATAIAPTGEIVSIGYAARSTHLTVVGTDGKIKDDRQIASAYCQTGSASADSNAVFAVRSACGKSQDPSQLVALNRKTGMEKVVNGIAAEPLYVLALDDKLVVISRKGNGSLLLQTVAKGQ
jgi:hypothetical protein